MGLDSFLLEGVYEKDGAMLLFIEMEGKNFFMGSKKITKTNKKPLRI